MTEDQGVSGEAVGAVLNGQWKLLRLVGEGGLAAVYEAEGLQGQGRRAIKLLHAQYRTRRHIVERFYTEAKACYTLRHPCITTVEAYAYAEDGSPYIVMELLEGESVEEFLAKGHPMPVGDAVTVTTGILQALSAAHARGLVHRDLKPANLFLMRDAAGRLSTKVLDFGIAKVMDVAGGMGSKTRTGALLGTPGYMSPEQVKDAKAVDARSDLWCVAVVLYEMLTCRHPFESADKLSRMIAVLRDPPRPISTWDRSLAAWEPFFARGLAKEPAERFQSAEQMADALRELARQLAPPATVQPQRTVAIIQPPQAEPAAAAAPPAPPAPSAVPTTPAPATPASGMPLSAMPLSAMPGSAMPGSAMNGSVPMPGQHLGPGSLQGMAQSLGPGSLTPAPVPARPGDKSWPIELISPTSAGGQPVSSGAGPAGSFGAPALPEGSSRTQVSASVASPPLLNTHMSGVPSVMVVTAADAEPPKLVWWGVVLVGLGCLALGIVLGYLLALA